MSKLGGGGLLVCVHYGLEIDLAALNRLLKDGGDSISLSVNEVSQVRDHPDTHSGGLAGSMMTASLLLSSVTR